jgi:hypothetical protein
MEESIPLNHTDNKLKAIISCVTSLEKHQTKEYIESKFDKRNSDSFINNYLDIVTPKNRLYFKQDEYHCSFSR